MMLDLKPEASGSTARRPSRPKGGHGAGVIVTSQSSPWKARRNPSRNHPKGPCTLVSSFFLLLLLLLLLLLCFIYRHIYSDHDGSHPFGTAVLVRPLQVGHARRTAVWH